MNDLVVVVADGHMQAAVGATLARHQSLGIREIQCAVFPHPESDPGVFRKAHDFLRPFVNEYSYALAMFDWRGCGGTGTGADIEALVQQKLNENGWRERSAVIVLEPELERWVWANSPHVATELGWQSPAHLRRWLEREGHVRRGEQKPAEPKKALLAALFEVRKPISASIYKGIATRVGLKSCVDPKFNDLRLQLQNWFPHSASLMTNESESALRGGE